MGSTFQKKGMLHWIDNLKFFSIKIGGHWFQDKLAWLQAPFNDLYEFLKIG